MFRYRFFDINLLINRTLVYSTLTAVIVGIYVLVVGYLGILFEEETRNLTLSLLATGFIAVIFQPVRHRLQRMVNRLMYGERDDPYTVLSRLGQRLEATLAPEAILPTIVETVAQALKLPYVAIALKEGDEFVVTTTYGSLQDDLVDLPLVYQADTIGQLLLSRRTPGEPFTRADWRLLEGLAHQAGIAAHGVHLTTALQRSREKLVTAREEERRRLQRNLHDGLGPVLASLTLKLDTVRNVLRHDPDAADAMLTELKMQTQATIADIRRMVYDLRPPALDQMGLIAAIREHVAAYSNLKGLQFRVETSAHLPPLPAAVEVAIYRIAQEALTNVASHAHARICTIRLGFDSMLFLQVMDDGVGLPVNGQTGVGLNSMRERAAELGGTCLIEPRPGGGTQVLARLPLKNSDYPQNSEPNQQTLRNDSHEAHSYSHRR